MRRQDAAAVQMWKEAAVAAVVFAQKPARQARAGSRAARDAETASKPPYGEPLAPARRERILARAPPLWAAQICIGPCRAAGAAPSFGHITRGSGPLK